ncbi:MAG: DUF3793 family protein [Oscillospiraceae bacterium]|nr:DUF3793 family protein [Oscillospiraceae bacterium]
MSEELVIRHCSPTLAGLKTGNLFSCSFASSHLLKDEIRQLNKRLVPKGLRVLPLRCRQNKALIYIFRPAKLKKDFTHSLTRQLLQTQGYTCTSPEKCVLKLTDKLQSSDAFPHEIGLFLGYPPEDVLGFIENKACNYKCCGCWKVYCNEEQAKNLFAKYKKCSDVYFKQWQDGKSVERLTVPT